MSDVLAVTGSWTEKTAGNHQGFDGKVWGELEEAGGEEAEMSDGYISGIGGRREHVYLLVRIWIFLQAL